MEGTPFGRYRLAELLGRGGMGEVWRAYDTVTDRDVAIKVLRSSLSHDPTFAHRFRREAQVAARLNHPHILPIHDYGEIDGQLFVDMRIVDGTNLAAALADGPLDPTDAVSIIEQVAKALQAAHRVELVHRDVKPSNILLDQDGFAYLIDFGIARASSHTALTGTGTAIGTWEYMAPERLTSNDLDARSDVYSLACVLYECLTGAGPYASNSFEQVIAGHIYSPPPRPSAAREGLPHTLDDVIATGLAKEVDKRYQTAVDLARAARAAISTPRAEVIRPAAWSPPTVPPPPDESLTTPVRLRAPVPASPPPAPRTVLANSAEAQSRFEDFPVGSWAKVVVGDKRFRDRIGKIVSSESPYVELKFRGSVGTYGFERSCVRIESRPQEPVPSGPTPVGDRDWRNDPRWTPAQPEPNSSIELREGGFALVVVGDKRFKGKIGKVTSVTPPYVELKFKGSVGTYSFQRSCLTPDDGRSW